MIVEREFDCAASSVGRARSFVVAAAAADDHTSDVLRLVVSELATNAVLHAKSAFCVRVISDDRLVRVEVVDESPELPTRRRFDPSAASGRGLAIIEKVAARWGVTPEGSGKQVWVELAAPV